MNIAQYDDMQLIDCHALVSCHVLLFIGVDGLSDARVGLVCEMSKRHLCTFLQYLARRNFTLRAALGERTVVAGLVRMAAMYASRGACGWIGEGLSAELHGLLLVVFVCVLEGAEGTTGVRQGLLGKLRVRLLRGGLRRTRSG